VRTTARRPGRPGGAAVPLGSRAGAAGRAQAGAVGQKVRSKDRGV
jgi:hypothetical protein